MSDFLEWLEGQHWFILKPGTLVEYRGSISACHGLWVASAQVSDDRYTLGHPINAWERLNADRDALDVVSPDA